MPRKSPDERKPLRRKAIGLNIKSHNTTNIFMRVAAEAPLLEQQEEPRSSSSVADCAKFASSTNVASPAKIVRFKQPLVAEEDVKFFSDDVSCHVFFLNASC